jgi:plasmid replication initiation protein
LTQAIDMQTNTLEATAKARFTLVAERDLLAAIEAHKGRIEQQTGMRVSLSQAATGLLRRGLELASDS